MMQFGQWKQFIDLNMISKKKEQEERKKGGKQNELINNPFFFFRYHANYWLTEFACSNRYVAAPTAEGKIFIWNLKSSQLVGVVATGGESSLRALLFHPSQPTLFCSTDGKLK
jgi:hypothetical protein